VAVGFGLIIPAIPIFAKSFGVSNTLIGFIISAFAIMRFISGLFAGKLVDRFGERLVLGVGLFMVSVFTLISGLAQNYEQLLIFRTAGGLGSSMFSVSAGALILRVVSDNQRGQAQSLYNGGFIAGGVAGPAFGGALIALSPRAPFFIYSGLLIVAGTVSLIFLHESRLGAKVEQSKEERALTISSISWKLDSLWYALIYLAALCCGRSQSKSFACGLEFYSSANRSGFGDGSSWKALR
jgi:MFS family permease